MKFLILTSSFRKKGNTALLVSLLEKSLQILDGKFQDSIEIETINLAYRNIQLCHGCRVCFDKGETLCPYWDDILEIKTIMQTADGIILASPVYVEDVNGVMKSWIDRLAHVCHRPEFGGKYAYLLTTSGTGTSGHALRTMASALRTWGYHIIGQSNFITGASMSEDELKVRFQSRLEQISLTDLFICKKAKSIISFIYFTYYFSKSSRLAGRKTPARVSTMNTGRQKAGLTPESTFYIPHRANWLTVTFARLLGSVIALFFP